MYCGRHDARNSEKIKCVEWRESRIGNRLLVEEVLAIHAIATIAGLLAQIHALLTRPSQVCHTPVLQSL